jgi:hypothetical protein
MSLVRHLASCIGTPATRPCLPHPSGCRRRRSRPLGIEGLESRHALSAVPLAAADPVPAIPDAAALVALRPAVDLNGDSIVDAIWRNTATGMNIGWLYDATGTVTSTRLLGGDATWAIEDVGDFNADAVSDLVWRNTSGSTVIWLMQADGAVASAGFVGGDATWRLEASGDYDGDSRTDIVWRDSTGGVNVMCLMNGITPAAPQMIGGDALWRLASTAADYDSNADGRTDLIWTSTVGKKVLHRMNGGTILSAALLSSDDNADLAGTGDFNGDGKHDLLWRNTPGTEVPGIVVGWLMDDGTVVSLTVLGGDLSWAVNNTADVNADGKTDILWRNAATGGTVAWIMNAFTATDHAVLGGDATWALLRRPGVHPA